MSMFKKEQETQERPLKTQWWGAAPTYDGGKTWRAPGMWHANPDDVSMKRTDKLMTMWSTDWEEA
jgi:hypothetical protein